jgi:flagellar basal-body rod protein FlgB
MKIFDTTMSAVETKLSLHARRHAVLAGNAANSDTPNFRARELDFAGELKKALKQDDSTLTKTHSGHMDLSSPGGSHLVFDNYGAMGNDGNNVDLDITMGKLGSNARNFDHAANFMSMKFRMLRTAAQSAGGI